MWTLPDLLRVAIGYLGLWIICIVYLAPLRHRARYRLRLSLFLLLGCAVGCLSVLFRLEGGWWALLACDLYAFLLLWSCGECSATAALYCSVWAVVSQQLTAEAWVLCCTKGLHLLPFGPAWLLLQALIYASCYCLFAFTVARWMPENGQYRVGPRQVSSAVVLLLIFELLFKILVYDDLLSSSPYALSILMAQCYCVTMLYLQNALFKKSAMKQELMTLNRLWYQQKEQYSLAKENIAIINRKCHDMKHQVAAMRAITGIEGHDAYLKEVEDSVRIYDSILKTGNEVLDTVLTEKSLYCEANQIKINCIADGRQLNFIDPVDLYAILGNALDNAIESVQQFQDKDKRLIDVLICTEQQFLVISIINPMRQPLTFEDDLPLSTKAHDGYHGFGLKSIRHTIEKYGGFLSLNVEDGCFALRILAPLSN